MREPETLAELKEEILRQLKESETVTITLTEGDGIHELLESISDGIRGTKGLNVQTGTLSKHHAEDMIDKREDALRHIAGIVRDKEARGEDILLGSTAFKSVKRWATSL